MSTSALSMSGAVACLFLVAMTSVPLHAQESGSPTAPAEVDARFTRRIEEARQPHERRRLARRSHQQGPRIARAVRKPTEAVATWSMHVGGVKRGGYARTS